MLCPETKYSIKCPYLMVPEAITIHNTFNDASAMSEISYMITNNNETSYHFAVDYERAVQGIPLDRNAWHSGDGNGTGNRKTIAIEICYSKSGGERFLKAEQNAAYLTAALLKQYGFGIEKVKKHQDWSGKYCPHQTLNLGWQRFLDMVQAYLNGEEPEIPAEPIPTPSPSVTPTTVNIDYAVKLEGGKILTSVRNASDFAGLENKRIVGFTAKVDVGHLKYQVHLLGKGWLPYVDGYDWNDFKNGYAGNDKDIIDAIRMYYDTPSDLIKDGGYRKVKYKVSPVGSASFYSNQLDDEVSKNPSMDGYAGYFGKAIDKVQAVIE